uniref:Arabidopsis retrotransposon Orf1 C-terminal domain-containing protein n=1 Tax=Brassica oleracea var. oleracea TaxID=109376 RepID=A0A0D3C4C6_BRAOL
MENQSTVSRIWDYYPKHKLEVFLGMKAILMDEKRREHVAFIGPRSCWTSGKQLASQAKESHIRNPVLRYATRLIGSLLYGTTTAASVTQWELCLLYQGVRHLLPAFGNSTFPPATAFNMGAVLAANLAGYKGKVTKSKNSACGFGAVITQILRHVGVDYENHQVALDRL